MRLATMIGDDGPAACVVTERGVAPAARLGDFRGDAMSLLDADVWARLVEAAAAAPDDLFRPRGEVAFTAPYRHPRKIWGIGLNYADHAAERAQRHDDRHDSRD